MYLLLTISGSKVSFVIDIYYFGGRDKKTLNICKSLFNKELAVMKMRLFFNFGLSVALLLFVSSCNKSVDPIKSLSGEQSSMGAVGNVVSSSSQEVAGVSNFTATVTELEDGVSTYTGSATVTNPTILNILSNAPECTVDGNTVSASNISFKSTDKGISSVSGLLPGIIVKYDAKVGDTYPIDGSNAVREVVSVSDTDDYSYGFFDIKVIKVVENTNEMGVSEITYWANHKWGLVGIQFKFDDGTTAKYPVYNSNDNF